VVFAVAVVSAGLIFRAARRAPVNAKNVNDVILVDIDYSTDSAPAASEGALT
jgi:hypothetical protein